MLLRAIAAFMAMPGVVTFALPIWLSARHPMRYVPLALTVVALGTLLLLIYALVTACVFYVRVLLVEECWAAGHFGAEWDTYRARVPRWIGTRSDSA